MNLTKRITAAVCALAALAVLTYALDKVPATMVKTSTNSFVWLTSTNLQANMEQLDARMPNISNEIAVASNLAMQAYTFAQTNTNVMAAVDMKVAYMGFKRLNNTPVLTSAGAGKHPGTYTTLITDTNLSTYIRGTNNANEGVVYYMDLGVEYVGMLVIVAQADPGDSDQITAQPCASVGAPDFSSAGIWRGSGMAWGGKDGPECYVGTNGIQKITVPFDGRYVGVDIHNQDTGNAAVYKLYEIIVYGQTNAWSTW
jgi:hypothetical protein